MKKYNFAVVGATGMVGRQFLSVMDEYDLPVEQLFLFASSRSAGHTLAFGGKRIEVLELTPDSFREHKIDIALFSAGGDISREYAPIAAASGAVVIDNSSAWRMDARVPLVVPEVNPEKIAEYKNLGIIANPNCSTIQAVVALKPIHDKYGIKRVIYSTYQAVSGAGKQGCDDLAHGIEGEPPQKFPYMIAFNCIPHIDAFTENGYTREEEKMIEETRKILNCEDMRVTATTVRVPVYNGHSESINIETEKSFDLEEVKKLLENSPGIIMEDDPENNLYPMPIDACGSDEVFVGRLRRDFSVENGLNMFVVADNIRKGAASNAVQIAQELIRLWEE
ncbi:MAG: aspartate-semialdehyde dehydrogenase [Clostridia bacterium]|nr:aspartate-semialdehyde dehydrogenase [Clostridia bacterium]